MLKIDQSMSIVPETEPIPNRGNSRLKSRAQISDGCRVGFHRVQKKFALEIQRVTVTQNHYNHGISRNDGVSCMRAGLPASTRETFAMSKTRPAARPPRRKASRSARSAKSFSSMPGMSDEDIIMLMSEALREGMGAGLFGRKDAVAQFAKYLEGCGNDEGPDEEQNAHIADLIGELSDLRIDCNGGDRRARENMRAVHDLLNSALDDGSLGPIDLIMTGKVFNDAGWTVPDRLKEAVAQALQSGTIAGSPIAVGGLSSLLLEFPENVENSPFDIHEFVCSLLAAFPSEACGHLLSALAALRRPEVNHALAGFVVHPDAVVARAATDALRTLAGHAPVESLLIERLVQIRPWLSQARQVHLDSAIKALRPHASPPREPTLPELIGCYVSVCDGSGARSVSISERRGAHYRLASVMMKPSGISDVMVIPELSKSEMGRLVRHVKSAVPTSKTDAAGVARMLMLALADNSTSASLPPFRLIEVVEFSRLAPTSRRSRFGFGDCRGAAGRVAPGTDQYVRRRGGACRPAGRGTCRAMVRSRRSARKFATPPQEFQSTRGRRHDDISPSAPAILGAPMRHFGARNARGCGP